MPVPKNKYRKGNTIFDMNTLIWEHLDKGRWVYLRNKVIHPGFLWNMSVQTVQGFINARLINESIDQQREYYAKKVGDYLKCH
jgi:hypothetical protein